MHTFQFPTTSNPIFRPPSNTPPVEKKIARVQPQVHSQPQITSSAPASAASRGKIDPIKALSSMASQPMTSTSSSSNSNLSISHHSSRPSSLSLEIHNEHQRSVGTQAKIGAPVKIISPRPWKSGPSISMQDSNTGGNISSGVSTSTSRFVYFLMHLCVFLNEKFF